VNLGTAQVIRGDARHLPLADNSVDLVVTSPPYFALRSYQDGGEHYGGQIGSEPTPAEFVDALLEVTRECVRVLKPSGSLWVNLGDKYAGSNGQQGGGGKSTLAGAANGRARDEQQAPLRGRGFIAKGAPPKSLIGIPWRYALRCIDDLGIILRAEVIWAKPNGLPESVTDRVRRSHEQWFHFTLQPRYFSAVDEIREAYDPKTAQRYTAGYGSTRKLADAQLSKHTDYYVDDLTPNPLGKLPGSVWTVPTEPLRVPDHLGIDHFAAFPTEWPKRIIQGWSPAGVCVECGEGRRPTTNREASLRWPSGHAEIGKASPRATDRDRLTLGAVTSTYTLTGYTCACGTHNMEDRWTTSTDTPPESQAAGSSLSARVDGGASNDGLRRPPSSNTPPTRPAVVLDPFGGTGTTALVAKALGRHGISVDMSADYCRLAEWRTNDRDQLAKVLGVAKAEQQDAAQLDLFGGVA
jgi:DNA modification methylase